MTLRSKRRCCFPVGNLGLNKLVMCKLCCWLNSRMINRIVINRWPILATGKHKLSYVWAEMQKEIKEHHLQCLICHIHKSPQACCLRTHARSIVALLDSGYVLGRPSFGVWSCASTHLYWSSYWVGLYVSKWQQKWCNCCFAQWLFLTI